MATGDVERLRDTATEAPPNEARALPREEPFIPVDPYGGATFKRAARLPALTGDSFVVPPPFDPARATYFDAVTRELALNDDELALLKRNGFVVSDRLAFHDFRTAYGYLHWKDL